MRTRNGQRSRFGRTGDCTILWEYLSRQTVIHNFSTAPSPFLSSKSEHPHVRVLESLPSSERLRTRNASAVPITSILSTFTNTTPPHNSQRIRIANSRNCNMSLHTRLSHLLPWPRNPRNKSNNSRCWIRARRYRGLHGLLVTVLVVRGGG